jgi:hypothetical protein
MSEDIYHRMYEVWLHDMLEPEEKLFVGRKPPREVKSWMTRPAPRDQRMEEEMLIKERAYLSKHGIIF